MRGAIVIGLAMVLSVAGAGTAGEKASPPRER
jgi:hypothetical protein